MEKTPDGIITGVVSTLKARNGAAISFRALKDGAFLRPLQMSKDGNSKFGGTNSKTSKLLKAIEYFLNEKQDKGSDSSSSAVLFV